MASEELGQANFIGPRTMRILFSTAHKYLPQMRGGMQLTVHQLCQGLRRRGHDVGVLAGLMPGGRFAQLARVRMKANSLLRGIKVVHLVPHGAGWPGDLHGLVQ